MAHSTANRARILALPPAAVGNATRATVADVREYSEPDGVWILATRRAVSVHARCAPVFEVPVVRALLGRDSGGVQHHRLPVGSEPEDGVDVVTVRDVTSPSAVRDHRFSGDVGAETATR